MNTLGDFAISKSLEINIDYNSNILKYIPDNTFGVFVNIKRSDKSINDKYKENIHGCLGYWENDFNLLNKEKLLEYIEKLSIKSTWNDIRNSNFNNIYKDSQTTYEIIFMLNEIYEIDDYGFCKELNSYYNNNSDYGILLKDINNNKSTYLPKFLNNKDWNYIRNTLLKKSNIHSNSYQFYAYNTLTVSQKIYKVLESDILSFYKNNYTSFINDYFVKNIPYYITSDKQIIYSKEDINILSFLNSVYELKNNINKETLDICDNLVENFKNKFKKNKRGFKKPSIFLLEILNKLDEEKVSKQIIEYLTNVINSLDPKFERYEALISIANNSSSNYKKDLIKNREIILKNLLENDYKLDDIFQYNWEVKYIYTLFILSIENNENIIKHSEIICNRIFNILDNLFQNQKIETIYLIIGFETLCHLLIFIYKNNDMKIKLLNNLFYIYSLLKNRYNNELGLFSFLDGTFKTDLTYNFINGIFSLKYNINYINNEN
tara:strand:+ start:5401 stop:6873 length:1473 start_codon:yes stop_codon:yes gene_type:complete